MSKKQYRLPDYLEHILEACRKIKKFTHDLSATEFSKNELIQDAVVRNIEIVGEAVANIRRAYPDFIATNPGLPWGDICDMRNQLIHGYMTVDLKIVWNTVERDIPALEERVRELHWRLGNQAGQDGEHESGVTPP